MEITYVMGGLAREYSGDLAWLVFEWLDAAAGSGHAGRPASCGGVAARCARPFRLAWL